ncbi:S-layer homology domain-containing protein, partial [Lysinibacillus fusiformis]|uniref:S-layer homology domain-containing protein n=1 Tax=Lysinibacillus fusiformis TaxID=28031 RepID=UPI0020C11724
VDVKPFNAHAGAIAAVAKLGIFEGGANGKFNTSSPITRAQIAKVLVVAYGLENNGGSVAFSDVPQNRWANGYISINKSNGIT